jgi:hypothetical protein
MSGRYLLGSRGRVDAAIEQTAYTAESSGWNELGITQDEIEPPNPNPHTPMPTGGHDGPYLNSPDPKEYELDATVVPTDENIPLETAIGSVTQSAETDYDKWVYSESRPLTTATLRHVQEDADLVAYYVGSKANLSVSASSGDPLQFDMSFTSAKMDYDDSESAPSLSSSVPTDVSPYRFHHLGTAKLNDPSDDSLIQEIFTVQSIDLSWDNGLEANHHGDGRDAYSVSEETNAERYDMSIEVKVEDSDLYDRVANNEKAVDIEIPFSRAETGGTLTDAIIIRLNDCTLVDAPLPSNPEGTIDSEITVLPLSTEIEIRRPN